MAVGLSGATGLHVQRRAEIRASASGVAPAPTRRLRTEAHSVADLTSVRSLLQRNIHSNSWHYLYFRYFFAETAVYGGSACPSETVVASWSDWSLWSDCSRRCGEGFHRRTRNCTQQVPHDVSAGASSRVRTVHSSLCSGSDQDWRVCNTQRCPGA